MKHSSEGLPLYCSGCTYRFTVFHFISHLDLNPFFFTIVLIDLISPRYVHVICLSNFFLLWFEKGFFLLIFCFNFFFVALCELFWHSPFLGFATNYLLSRSRDELSHYFENDELHGVYADTHTDTHTHTANCFEGSARYWTAWFMDTCDRPAAVPYTSSIFYHKHAD